MTAQIFGHVQLVDVNANRSAAPPEANPKLVHVFSTRVGMLHDFRFEEFYAEPTQYLHCSFYCVR